MVVIHVKINGSGGDSQGGGGMDGGGGDDGFLWDTTTDTPNDTLIDELILVYNLRKLSNAVAQSVRGLALHGPMKSDDEKAKSLLRQVRT
jgi:hypothetical protein